MLKKTFVSQKDDQRFSRSQKFAKIKEDVK
jgi:hypothetical protein